MNNTTEPNNKKSLLKNLTSNNRNRLLILFVVIFAAIGVYALLQAGAAPKNNKGGGKGGSSVSLTLSPASQRLQQGEELALAIKLNTNGQDVNAAQASITYPADKFEFIKVDNAGSAFGVEAPTDTGSGTLTVARGSITPVNSADALLATVYLRATGTGRKVQVKLTSDSTVIHATEYTDILQKMSNGSYTIN